MLFLGEVKPVRGVFGLAAKIFQQIVSRPDGFDCNTQSPDTVELGVFIVDRVIAGAMRRSRSNVFAPCYL
jgi:hypothetical protein